MTDITRRVAPLRPVWIVPILLALGFSPSGGLAGELSEVSAAPRPALTLPDLDGEQRSLDDFAGKVLLVNFWASWCRPCLEEMPSIQRLAAELGEESFAVIGVNVAEGIRRVQATVKRLGLAFPVLLDKDQVAFNNWGATVLPTTYILDGAGRVRYVGRGPLEWDRTDVVELLQNLASQPPKNP